MPEQTQTIIPIGGMNVDLHPNYIKDGQSLFEKNIITDYNQINGNATGQSHTAGSVTPVVSNITTFDGTMPDGKNIDIGAYYDENLNQLIWMVWNSAGNHTIWLYDAVTQIYSKVIQSSLLPFDVKERIGNIDLVYIQTRDDGDVQTLNRLVYFSSRNSFPCKLNIDKALAGGYDSLQFLATPDQFMQVIKYPPYYRPIQLDTDTNPDPNFIYNYIKNKQFQFRYFFYYDDGEQSRLSADSTLMYYTDSDNNFFQLQFDAGSSLVVKIGILYRLGNTGEWRLYDTIDRATILLNTIYPYNSLSNQFEYKFYNDKQYSVFDQTVASANFDLVPFTAGAQAYTLGNLLMYSDIEEGTDNLSAAECAKPTVSVVYTRFAPLTLTLVGNFPFAWAGSPSGGDSFQIVLYRIQAATGITSQVNVYTVHPASSNPLVTNDSFTDIDKGDIIYYAFGATSFGMGVSVTLLGGGGRLLTGTFTNIPKQLSCGTGNFTVDGTNVQNVVTNDRIIFDAIVTDPCGTWNTTANEEAVANSRSGLAQLKTGGKYKLALIEMDNGNREGFANILTNCDLNIRTITQDSAFMTHKITVNFNGITLHDDTKNVVLARTKELTVDRTDSKGYITFIIDDVKFLKADFTEGDPSTDIIKTVQFTLATLLKFETDFNFNTTMDYVFAPNDRIEIIRNGDGAYYGTNANGLLDFVLNGTNTQVAITSSDKFSFEYNSHLANLVSKAQVRIYTPAKAPSINTFYEIISFIHTTGIKGFNQPYISSIELDTFDTFPIFWNSGYVPDVVTDNGATPFEHHSIYAVNVIPSNGEDIGRVHINNPNAQRIRRRALIRISLPYITDTFVNGLSTFNSDREKQCFEGAGAVVKLNPDQYNLAVIQETNAFVLLISKNIVTLGDGQAQLTASSELLSDPIIIQGGYGCQNNNTFIDTGEGMMWVDDKRAAWCFCNWRETVDVTKSDSAKGISGGMKSYFENKLKYIYNYNQQNIDTFWQVHAGYDPKFKDVNLTFFLCNKTEDETEVYINNLRDVSVGQNETVAYNMKGGVFKMFAYTPEFYSYVEADRNGLSMVAFKNGVPYFFNQSNVNTFNNFFGVDTDQIIEVVMNVASDTIKTPLAIDVDSSMLYFIDRILTNVSSVGSHIPPVRFKQEGQIFHASFLRNENSSGGLYGGQVLRGKYVRIRLVRDNTVNNNVNMIDGDKQKLFNIFNSVLVKFVVTERSGK